MTYIDGVGVPEYQWYQSTECTADPNNATLLVGQTTSSYTPLTDQVGVLYYFAELTFLEGGCGSIVSECARVEVVADPLATITTPSVSEICDGGEIDDLVVTYTGGVGTPTYQWYDASTGQAINGATLDTYNPGILVEGSYGYYVEISFNDNPDNGCDLATSQTVSFEVVADPVLTDLLVTQTVCLGSPVTALEAEASGGCRYDLWLSVV